MIDPKPPPIPPFILKLGGLHAGEALTGTGVNTTDRGRDFLYELLGVRRPTTEEIARANSGSYGIINANVNNVVKQ